MNSESIFVAIQEVPYQGDYIHAEYFDTEESCAAWIATLVSPRTWRTQEITRHIAA